MRDGCSNARYATDFMDAQLTTLYNIACDRIKCYTDKGIDRSEQSGYDFALREYHYESTGSPPIRVVFEFNVPRVEFICDHYAIIYLTIENAVSCEATPFSFGDGPVTVSIGVPLKIDVSSGLFIYKLTLNPNEVTFEAVRTGSTTLELTEAHRLYLDAYLQHLIKSKNDVLYLHPSLNNDDERRANDPPCATTVSSNYVKKVAGIGLKRVAEYVKGVWLEAALQALQPNPNPEPQSANNKPSNRKPIAVAKWERGWLEKPAFDAKFGPPIVLSCEHETILIFSIEHIVFPPDTGSEPEKTFQDWNVAVSVDVIPETPQKGATRSLRINAENGGKFIQRRSRFANHDYDDLMKSTSFKPFIPFMCREYLQSLKADGFSLFYESRVALATAPRKDMTELTENHGFEQIIALPRTSLDNALQAYYDAYEWMQSSSKDGFEINFGAPQICLINNEHALMFISLKSATIRADADKYDIENWALAFEVKLVATMDPNLQVLRLWVQFEGAKFNPQLSKFDKYFPDHRASPKVVALVKHLQARFLRQIQSASANILCSIVVSKDQSAARPRHAFSCATFKIHSKGTVTYQNYNTLPDEEEPFIIILGMTNPKKQLPSQSLPTDLYIRRPSIGSLALSFEAFFNGRLLPHLARINRETTILPENIDVHKGAWTVASTTWRNKHGNDKDDKINPTDWEEIRGKILEYKWDYYRCKSDSECTANDPSGITYYVSVKTDNRLTISTSFRGANIKGTSVATVGWRSANGDVKYEAFASWNANVAVKDAGGLSMEITKSPQLHYQHKPEVAIPAGVWDPMQILESNFPNKKDFEEPLVGIDGIWDSISLGPLTYGLTKPSLTEKGGLLLELHEDGQKLPVLHPSSPTRGVSHSSPSTPVQQNFSAIPTVSGAAGTALTGGGEASPTPPA